MTRTFDLISSDLQMPVPVLWHLADRLAVTGTPWVLIGAAARDLTIHGPAGEQPARATKDLDIAVAVSSMTQFDELASEFERDPKVEHRIYVQGVEVDVVPFGEGVERGGEVRFRDANRLDVVGLAEAAAHPDWVRIDGTEALPVASIEVQTVLKILAWRDRRQSKHGPKDAIDLSVIMLAASEGRYADEVWNDDEALTAADDDPVAAGGYRLGRDARRLFSAERSQGIRDVLVGDLHSLIRDMRSLRAKDVVGAYRSGFMGAPLGVEE